MRTEDRLAAKTRRAENGCLLWTGSKNVWGYGQFRVGSRTDGTCRTVRAHRVAWEIANGPLPAGMCVLHTCDNPACVEPSHLWMGTHHDNALDRSQKGRHGKSKRGLPRGVNLLPHNKSRPYMAQVTINGARRCLGCFATADEAHFVAEQVIAARLRQWRGQGTEPQKETTQ